MTALKIKITEMSNKDIKQTWNFVFLFKIAGLSQLIHHTCNYWYVLITIIQYIYKRMVMNICTYKAVGVAHFIMFLEQPVQMYSQFLRNNIFS